MKHVYIVGSKGIPARYGGFETFVEELTSHKLDSNIQYHVACATDDPNAEAEFEYNGAHCFTIPWRNIGSARAITYDLDALNWVIRHIEQNGIERPVVYVLACRIGPFVERYAKRIHALGGVLLVNPDGHEWKRSKWPLPVQRYWKYSEGLMVRHADLLVCDSRAIESYIQDEYATCDPQTCYIAYGADVCRSTLSDDDEHWTNWLAEHGLAPGSYYLVVGRFVPENNYETMLKEFCASNSSKSFVLVTDAEGNFLDELDQRTGYASDARVKFVGTIYDQDLLRKVRENAFAYLHGHEVGGTNPSLLEALAATPLNLLLDVSFNREVAEDAALYWSKDPDSLVTLMRRVEGFSDDEVASYAQRSTQVIEERYSWKLIVSLYERLFNELAEEALPAEPEGERELTELQKVELDMFKIVRDICNKHGLRYYALGGTLLGAVRHQGFIPWDDDIDVAMPRPDYEEFLTIAPRELPTVLKLQTYDEQDEGELPRYFCQIQKVDSEVVAAFTDNPIRTRVWIDVFPLDPMPTSTVLRNLHKYHLLYRRMCLQLSMFERNVHRHRKGRPLHERAIIKAAELTHVGAGQDTVEQWKKLDKALAMYDYDDQGYAVNVMGAYKFREMFPQSWLEPSVELPFEDTTITCPGEYHKVLEHMYGDYMTPVPPQNRNDQHGLTVLEVGEDLA